MIGVMVSAGLLAVYQLTEFFYINAIKLEVLLQHFLILPGKGELVFHQPIQYVFFTVMAFVSAWVGIDLPHWFGKLAFIFRASFLTLLMAPALAFCGILFEPFSGVAAIVIAGTIGLVFGGGKAGKKSRKLLQQFAGRISKGSFETLLAAPENTSLSGTRELTVLTAQILNHAELNQQLTPRDLELLASLFEQTVAEFLVAEGAYLDTCHPKGIRVLIGMLDQEDDHALRGCRMAIALHERLVKLEQEILTRWKHKPLFGIALATGPMSVGLYGYGQFENYSALGDSLDYCHRLCSVNLVYGSQILISMRTYHLAKEEMEVRPMEMVYAPKLHQISEVYELLGAKGTMNEDEIRARDAYWQGVVSLRKGAFKEAMQQFKKSQIANREDAPLKYFMDRAEAGLREGVENSDRKGALTHARMLNSY
ncbi:hypothetical protein BH11VER1_BH11VER1_41470 [soil metagenome]